MTCNVFGGTLSLTQSINQSQKSLEGDTDACCNVFSESACFRQQFAEAR